MILVSRSIELSNTLYSVLFESEGLFITLGREWIGSLVKYDRIARCYSKMFAANDRFFTDTGGVLNDECEYFANGIVNKEKIFIQNLVFDTTFEIDFNFGKDLKVNNFYSNDP